MTRKELRKEATMTVEWECTLMVDRPLFVHAYITGAEPREKRIAELEKEIAELKEKLETTEKTRDYWKDSSFDWRHKCTSRKPFRVAVKAQRQLTKAKELIDELSSSLSVVGECGVEECELLNRAEQFLKDSEVVK